MKKVTIITPPEYEGLVLEALGRSQVTQLKEVMGHDFERLMGFEKEIDYKALYEKIHSRYLELLELGGLDVKQGPPNVDELRKFTAAPEAEATAVLEQIERLVSHLKEVKEAQNREVKHAIEDLQEAIEEQNAAYEEARKKIEAEILRIVKEGRRLEEEFREKYEGAKARLESIRALQPEEFKRCFTVGVAKNDIVARLEEYLNRYPDVFYRVVKVTSEDSFLFIFGSEEARKWVDALFLVFDVKDIFNVLATSDVLLVLDPEKRKEAIDRYQEELKRIEEEKTKQASRAEVFKTKRDELEEKIRRLDETHKQNIEKLKQQYDARLKQLEAKHAQEIEALKKEQTMALSKVAYMDYLLRTLSDKRVHVLRTKVISVLQGWVPEKKIPVLEKAIETVESKTGESLFLKFEMPGHEDHDIPTPTPEFKPSFLQPAWTLTTLRGWPSAHEVNPSYITILVFCFQFGLMFGDVGQGAIFLLLGLFLIRRYKRGMMSKLGVMFIPMGISAIIFGFLYDSVFLIEGLLTHHPILPNPVEHTTKLMLLVFQIAVLEVVAGLVLGAVNEYREGHKWGVIGEHGLGMILYVVGLYLSAMYFIRTGNFTAVLSHWTFMVMIAGMVLSMLEPILVSISQHKFSFEVVGEGIGALLMTFVEGLANLFSFLRIAAFALAHASLAIAAHNMSHFMGVGGFLLMNIIAMSFEFISSSVQSLRLLYYEFMGKFFQGEGVPFKPFRLRNSRSRQAA